MIFSLIICTYNRADILKITLPYYSELIVPSGIQLEILIVNNNSNDDTEKYVKNHIDNYKKNDRLIRYSFEAEQGLSHARNRGYHDARGDYIAYLDDECILPNDWVELACQYIKSQKPAFLGGPYYGKYLPGSTSNWFKESYGDSYILQYKIPTGIMHGRYLSGGNLIIRRDVFRKIGLFDTDFGMNGNDIGYGEEQDFQKRLIEEFPSEIIYYAADLFVWHLIRNEKMSILFLFKDALIRGRSSAKLNKNHSVLKLIFSPVLLVFFSSKAILSFVWKALNSFFSKEHFYSYLYQDYKKDTWRNIGAFEYLTKKTIKCFLKSI